MKPTCYVMVGLPGSGKSTFVHNAFKINPDVFVYSTDDYIESVAAERGKTYDDVFQQTIKDAIKSNDFWLEYAIKDNRDVIWDQTNTGRKKRLKIVNKMKANGYNLVAVVFLVPETQNEKDELVRRLASRKGKTIPNHVMESMWKNFTYPTKDEGFDMIKFATIEGKLVVDHATKNV